MHHLWWYLDIAECLVALVAWTAVIHRTDPLNYHERLACIHSWSGHSGGHFSTSSYLLAAINIRDHVIFGHTGPSLRGIVESNQVIGPSSILGIIWHSELKVMRANLTCSAAILLHDVALGAAGRDKRDTRGRDGRTAAGIIHAPADLHFVASILQIEIRLGAFLKHLGRRLQHGISTLSAMRLGDHLEIAPDHILHLIWGFQWVIAIHNVLVLRRRRRKWHIRE